MRPGVGDIVTINTTAQGYAKQFALKQAVVIEVLESGSGVKVDLVTTGYGQTFTVWWSEIQDGNITLEQVIKDLFSI